MSHLLTNIHTHDVVTIRGVYVVETLVHLLLCTESLDNAKSAKSFFHLTHGVAPERLGIGALRFQFSAHKAHEPTKDRHKDNGEESELPANGNKGAEINNYEDRVFEKHVETRHDAVLHLLHIATHAGNDITFAFFAKEAKVQRSYLLIYLVSNVAHNSCADRNDGSRRKEIGACLQECHECQKQTNDEQCCGGTCFNNKVLHIVCHVVHQNVLKAVNVPFHQLGSTNTAIYLKQNLQDRYKCQE